jgi:hypothetical protein
MAVGDFLVSMPQITAVSEAISEKIKDLEPRLAQSIGQAGLRSCGPLSGHQTLRHRKAG